MRVSLFLFSCGLFAVTIGFIHWVFFDDNGFVAMVEKDADEKREEERLDGMQDSRFQEQEIGDSLHLLTDKNTGVHYLQVATLFRASAQLSTIPLINTEGLPVSDEDVDKNRFKITEDGENRLILDTITDVEYLVISKFGYKNVEIIPLLNLKGDFNTSTEKPKIQY